MIFGDTASAALHPSNYLIICLLLTIDISRILPGGWVLRKSLMNTSFSSVFPACSDFHEVDLHGGDERSVNIDIASEIQPR
jgi:hypothetical protein